MLRFHWFIHWLLQSLLVAGIWTMEASAQTSPLHKILTLGNTAELNDPDKLSEAIKSLMSEGTTLHLLINGDLISGKEESLAGDLDKATGLIKSLASIANSNIYIIPGDRDWANSGPGGLRMVKRLEDTIEDLDLENVHFTLDKGCPGPDVIDIEDHIRIIMFNSQWFNHPYDKPWPEDADCKVATAESFYEELREAIDERENRYAIIAGHFPLASLGRYGGHYPFLEHLKPLPLVGSFRLGRHQFHGNPRDLSHQNYRDFNIQLNAIIDEYQHLILLSAHEHDLELFPINSHWQINNGGFGRYSPSRNKGTQSWKTPGFVAIDLYQSGKLEANVWQFEGQTIKNLYSKVLLNNSNGNSEDVAKAMGSAKLTPGQTSARVPAGPEYAAGGTKRFLLGKHHREAWLTEIEVPVLNLETTYGGLRPFEKGGGRQTTSIKLKGGDGRQYVFRSVNKDPSKAISAKYRNTIISKTLRDQTTTQHPYGALVTDILLNELGILHPHPRLYLLPEREQLGEFGAYAGLLGMLEEHPTRVKNVKQPFAGADKVLKTEQLFRELYKSAKNQVAAHEFARARLFDILVGDWGKHEDNWKWAGYKTDSGFIYRPIPRDRDHVFSLWDGLLPWLADREWAKPSGENFGHYINDIRSLTWQARHLDRLLANELTKEDWIKESKFIQEKLRDEIVEDAFRNLPKEIYGQSGELISKLKQRLKDLPRYAEEYYRLLAREVDVVGTNDDDQFQVRNLPDGSMEVSVTTTKKDQVRHKYHRNFTRQETDEVRLYGLGGQDKFEMEGAGQQILLRLVPGPDKDSVEDPRDVRRDKGKTYIYDIGDKSQLTLGPGARVIRNGDAQLYNYRRTAFRYNTYFPSISLGYNRADGFILNAGVSFRNQNFDKEPYSSWHQFRGSVTTESNFTFNYDLRLRHVVGKWDFLGGLHIGQPNTFNYFFGLGNDTEKDDALFDDDFYRVRYDSRAFNIGLERIFLEKSFFNITLGYENAENRTREGNIIEQMLPDEVPGLDQIDLLTPSVTLDYDLRDDPGLSTRGIRLFTSLSNGFYLDSEDSNYVLWKASLETYYPIWLWVPTSLGIKIGGWKSSGDIPYYKLPYLGQRNNLRGFFRNRFTGESSLYLNTDYRLHLFHWQNDILPMEAGLLFFYDLGRIYDHNDVSDDWHQGYGGGFFLYPLDLRSFTFSFSFGFSEEESALFSLTIGSVFKERSYNRR